MQFNTELEHARYDEERNLWVVDCSTREAFTARYLITALGLLSKTNFPNIKGIETFLGEMYHTGYVGGVQLLLLIFPSLLSFLLNFMFLLSTSKWPQSHDFTQKRVGIIGNGSTGVQVITEIAKEVKSLTCFQRTPQYSVPSGDGPVSKEYRDSINSRWDEIWAQVRNSNVAFGFEESTVPTLSVSAEERERIFEEAWRLGNGFRFMFWTFNDLTVDGAANEEACKFIRKKIRETVRDPEKARKLQPDDFYARRPLCDAGYYEQFNRENVDIVSLKETPIQEITETGVTLVDGTRFDLDVLIFATGFDAVDGNYTRVAIQGRDGVSLRDHWAANGGPTTYLGSFVPGFPNFFMLTGPNSPFTNLPPTIETQVEFISDIVGLAESRNDKGSTKDTTNALSNGISVNGDIPQSAQTLSLPTHGPVIEALPESEQKWTQLCKDLCENSLFKRSASWIFGANIPGKTQTVMFYFGGLAKYRKILADVVDAGYSGFKPF